MYFPLWVYAPPTMGGMSKLANYGIAACLLGLLVPFLGICAMVVGAVCLMRSEIGPGLGVIALGALSTLGGVFIALMG